MSEYPAFPKIPRWNREVTITEKIDGTNGLVYIENYSEGGEITDQTPGVTIVHRDGELYAVRAGSRNRWLTRDEDNFGFAKWVEDNAAELVELGPGKHYGEWYGKGIQRGYGLQARRFELFNVFRWRGEAGESLVPDEVPALPVPLLHRGPYSDEILSDILERLKVIGSHAVHGYLKPEGVIIHHSASRQSYKVLLENDDKPKGQTT